MATSEVVSYGGYSSEVVSGSSFGGCVGYSTAETAAVFPPVPLTIQLDQSAPAATASGSFELSGSITSSEAITTATLSVNGVTKDLVLDGAGAFAVVVDTLNQGFNTLVVDASDPDESAQETLVVAYQPAAQLRDVLVLDPVSIVIERMPWHLRASR